MFIRTNENNLISTSANARKHFYSPLGKQRRANPSALKSLTTRENIVHNVRRTPTSKEHLHLYQKERDPLLRPTRENTSGNKRVHVYEQETTPHIYAQCGRHTHSKPEPDDYTRHSQPHSTLILDIQNHTQRSHSTPTSTFDTYARHPRHAH